MLRSGCLSLLCKLSCQPLVVGGLGGVRTSLPPSFLSPFLPSFLPHPWLLPSFPHPWLPPSFPPSLPVIHGWLWDRGKFKSAVIQTSEQMEQGKLGRKTHLCIFVLNLFFIFPPSLSSDSFHPSCLPLLPDSLFSSSCLPSLSPIDWHEPISKILIFTIPQGTHCL